MAPKTTEKKRKAGSTDPKTTAKKARTSLDGSKQEDSPVRSTKSKSKPTPAKTAPVDVGFEEFDSASEDDQTAALLKGFESSDESGGEEQDANAVALDISTLPDPSTALAKQKTSLAKSSTYDQSSLPTVIYLSRIPHGFYEAQMKSYFAQFGDIKRLRLARNRKTGASKHYAFIEFEMPEVAKIVQQTMNNYLMFKHILKARLVPKADVHPNLWKGAGKRFKAVPWNRIERSRVAGTDREGWSKRVRNEEARRLEKQKKLEALGYAFKAPELVAVESVPLAIAGATPAEAETEDSAVKLIAATADDHDIVEKTTKKNKKGSAEVNAEKAVKAKDGAKTKKSSKKAVAV